MSPRVAPVLAIALVAFAVAACTGAPVPSTASPSLRPFAPAPTLVATASPDTGDVAGPTSGPQLSVEPAGTGTIRVTVADAAAKAWRITVAGTGDHSGDRWVLQVETGDVGPAITTTETVAGRTFDPVDRSSLADGSSATRICSTTLPVCVEATGFRLPQDGDGTLSATLVLADVAAQLEVTGETATWPGEPFLLGPWATTEAFPWGS